jgi:hypothetical protein
MLALCKVMGMSYDELRALPQDVFAVLVEDFLQSHANQEVPV